MNYVGMDYHKKYSHATAVNEQGDVMQSRRFNNRPEDFEEFFSALDGPSKAVVEASRTWGVMYDLLEGLDGVESVTLAQLLRANLIPAAYIPGREPRSFKEMIRQRVFLVRMRTRLKNRTHVLLDRLHIPMPSVTDVFGKRGTACLKRLKLQGVDGEILRENLKLLEVFNELVKGAEGEVQRLMGDDPRVKLLRTIPGLGPILAAVVAMEIDDVERFKTSPKLASYAGLVPSTYASGGKIYHGRLLPMSNKWLRWAFVEAAWVSIRHSPYCRTFYESRKRRKGAHKAAIAMARRMSEIVWCVLKEYRAYEERPCRMQRRTFSRKASPAALAASWPSGLFSRVESGGSNCYRV